MRTIYEARKFVLDNYGKSVVIKVYVLEIRMS